ncbi:MAG: GMC family oxidoreductase [Thermomicrobiales bacterium]|nr:GMC family oxidoreductase [Thermomicrobiales bacterium]
MTNQQSGFDCDVAIVGSGVAGALIGWQLAQSGAKVIILEAGPPMDRSTGVSRAFASAIPSLPEAAYPNSPWAPTPSSLNPQSYYVQTGPDMFASNYERLVGGTTWHWLGTAIRLIPNDFSMKSTYGVAVDWPITYDDLEPWYLTAEQTIGVAGDSGQFNGAPRSGDFPMPAIPLTWSDKKFEAAARTLDLEVLATPAARVSTEAEYNGRPQCCGNAFCIPMCPIGAKYDATVHLDLATQAGAEIRDSSVVFRLDADENGAITTVHYRRPDKTDESLTAKIVVVAAHAIETPKLLLMSATDKLPNGLANSSDLVGRHLMDHPSQLSYALANDPMGPYRSPLSTAGIEQLRDGDERSTRGAFRIEIGNDGWSWPGMDPVSWSVNLIEQGMWGTDLYDQVAKLNVRAVRMAALCEQLPDPNSRVTLSDKMDAIGLPRPELHYVIDDYAKDALAAARDQFTAIFDALGTTQLTHVEAVQGAGHVMGTCCMGSEQSSSVTDSFGRTWDHPNLWIAGSSLFPTTGTGNPTLTIAALAMRAAPEITKALAEMN